MALPLSMDLRERIVAAVNAGISCRAAAERFIISYSTAIMVVRRARETGSVAPARIGGYHRPKLRDR